MEADGGEVADEAACGEAAAVDRLEHESLVRARGLVRALSADETRGLEDEFIANAAPEDLAKKFREKYERVRLTGVGVCGTCRWETGCINCDEAMTWAWACRNTLYEAMSAEVRPKARPRGRPRKTR